MDTRYRMERRRRNGCLCDHEKEGVGGGGAGPGEETGRGGDREVGGGGENQGRATTGKISGWGLGGWCGIDVGCASLGGRGNGGAGGESEVGEGWWG